MYSRKRMTGAMKVSDFMLNLSKKLQEERKIAESTSTQYLQTLHKLNGGKPFNNLAWAKKYDDVQKIIDTYSPSTQGNQYMVLSSALSLFNDKATYKGAYNHWRDKMMEARKERDSMPIHEKNEKQEENWLTWEEVDKKKSALKEDISSFHLNKHITASQFDKLLQYLVLSLYSDIQPRRNQDYLDMFVVKKLGKDYEKTKNYYDLSTQRFIFNKYKTAKKHGEQIENVPESLQATLKTYLTFHPLSKSKAKEYKLLVKPDGSPLNTVNSITRILNRIFGKNIGSSALRHSYLSSKYGNVMKEMEGDAEAMGHTTGIQKNYIKYD
jgi:integrase